MHTSKDHHSYDNFLQRAIEKSETLTDGKIREDPSVIRVGWQIIVEGVKSLVFHSTGGKVDLIKD